MELSKMELSNRKIWVIGGALILAAFLIGLALVSIKNRSLNHQMIVTREKNFSEARERSTRFFDGLRQFTYDTQDNSLREKLMAILNRRDEITADLTAAKAGVTEKMRALYREMYQHNHVFGKVV